MCMNLNVSMFYIPFPYTPQIFLYVLSFSLLVSEAGAVHDPLHLSQQQRQLLMAELLDR